VSERSDTRRNIQEKRKKGTGKTEKKMKINGKPGS
jgi:hypothetical protein